MRAIISFSKRIFNTATIAQRRTVFGLLIATAILIVFTHFLPMREKVLFPSSDAHLILTSQNSPAPPDVGWINKQEGQWFCRVVEFKPFDGCEMGIYWSNSLDKRISLDTYSFLDVNVALDGPENSLMLVIVNTPSLRPADQLMYDDHKRQLSIAMKSDMGAAVTLALDEFVVEPIWLAKNRDKESAHELEYDAVSHLTVGANDLRYDGINRVHVKKISVRGYWLSPRYVYPGLALIYVIGLFLVAVRYIAWRYPNTLTRTISAVSEATRAAERANQEKLNFLSSASHDLRQPLHNIGFLIEELELHIGRSVPHSIISRFEKSHEYLVNMVNTLLDVSRLDEGNITPNKTGIDVKDIVIELQRQFSLLASHKGLVLEVDSESIMICSDRQLLLRIIGNLVSNAIKYSHAGKIQVAAKVVDQHVVIKVADQGVGMSSQNVRRAFEPFYQVDNLARRQESGLGLGLHIVERLCQLLECDISVESEENVGSTFTLRLPVSQDTRTLSQLPHLSTDNKQLAGMIVLLVENERDILSAMQTSLAAWGCGVLAAQSYEEAISIIDGEEVHAIISDFMLDETGDGVHVIRDVRVILDESALPALLITGESNILKTVDYDMNDIAIKFKPVAPIELKQYLMSIYLESVGNA